MRLKSVRAFILIGSVACLVAWLAVAERKGGLAVTAVAQEGYPLAGTWYGDYGTASQKSDLTVVMKWDGKSVTGTVNPGPNAIPIKSAVMDITPGKPAPEGRNSTTGIPPVFKVHLEFNAPGGPTVFEGTIQNPVAGNRRISGTWTRGAERGTFQLRHL